MKGDLWRVGLLAPLYRHNPFQPGDFLLEIETGTLRSFNAIPESYQDKLSWPSVQHIINSPCVRYLNMTTNTIVMASVDYTDNKLEKIEIETDILLPDSLKAP